MITLGIECSSRCGSVVLLKDGGVLAEKSWIADRVRHNVIFETLTNLVEEGDISYRDISLFAVGRGPGSFSGMRMSFAIAQALALPSNVEVRTISSGAALALAISREGADHIAVVGDARRGQIWIGFFQPSELGGVKLSKDWELVPYEEVVIPNGTVVVSPEAERLGSIFPSIGAPRFPSAKEVAELALMQAEREPLEPLYMHPPVFIEPRFT